MDSDFGLFDARLFGGGWKVTDPSWFLFQETPLKPEYAARAVGFHRDRTTTRDIFIQHLRYGYGLALIYNRYRGKRLWGWWQSLQTYRDLGKAAFAGITTTVLRGRSKQL